MLEGMLVAQGVLILLVLWLALRRPPPSPLAPVADGLADVRAKVEGLTERIRTVEAGHAGHADRVQDLLRDTARGVAALRAQAQARHDQEERTARSLQRLEAVLAGSHSKGAAGEHLVDSVFSQLPPDWQVRDFRVGNRCVEFGLRLPNGLILPIDSKWPGTSLLDALARAEDPSDRQRLQTQIGRAHLDKAREVQKYVDPDLTVPFGLAVVPDAVHALTVDVHVRAFSMNVVVVSATQLVPYLMLVFQTFAKMDVRLDTRRLMDQLDLVASCLDAARDDVEGRLSRALVMASNSRDELRTHLARAAHQLSDVQKSSAA